MVSQRLVLPPCTMQADLVLLRFTDIMTILQIRGKRPSPSKSQTRVISIPAWFCGQERNPPRRRGLPVFLRQSSNRSVMLSLKILPCSQSMEFRLLRRPRRPSWEPGPASQSGSKPCCFPYLRWGYRSGQDSEISLPSKLGC